MPRSKKPVWDEEAGEPPSYEDVKAALQRLPWEVREQLVIALAEGLKEGDEDAS